MLEQPVEIGERLAPASVDFQTRAQQQRRNVAAILGDGLVELMNGLLHLQGGY